MAPTPEERGVADRGLGARGVSLPGSRPDGYEEIYTAQQVFAAEPIIQGVMKTYSTKKLVERARAKHAFLVGFSEELGGTAAEVARAQSHLAVTLLAMKDEMDWRVENPGQGSLIEGLGTLHFDGSPVEKPGAVTGPPISLLDHMDPFMHYRTWQSYVLPYPKPRRRKPRGRQQPRWRTPIPDFSANFRTSPRRPGFGPTPGGIDREALRKAADPELEKAKKIINELMEEQTEIYNKISFVMDGSALVIDFAEVAGMASIGVQVVGVGLAAASVLLGVLTTMGQGVQASVATTQKNGVLMGFRHLYRQLEELDGRLGKVSARQAYDDILKDKLAYDNVRLVYSLSDEEFTHHLQKGIIEAATVVNTLIVIADRLAKQQLAKRRRQYTTEEIRELLPKIRYEGRRALYRALQKKLKFR